MGLVLIPFQVSTENDFEINLMHAFPNLSFEQPVDFQYANDGTNRVFVVGQEGVIWVFNNSASTSVTTVFLNFTDRVRTSNEEGLLGLAFHPDFNDSRCFYVYYSAADEPRRSVIARYNVSLTDPNQADKESELVLLEILQPYSNHNGGQLAFGPEDGYLYIATGDGGSGGDPQGNAQNLTNLLGSILRIDVDNPSNGKNYSIPVDNPVEGNLEGYREEIFAYGFRNPWRFSFDPEMGWLWAGDVGQSEREEINIVEKGKNYGWNIKEGSSCFNPPSGCNSTGLVDPIWEYDHSVGNAIIGGYIYRGEKFKDDLEGIYIYGDFGTGLIWGLSYNGTTPADVSVLDNSVLMDSTLRINSFGVDKDNEFYILSSDDNIYAIESIIPKLDDFKLLWISIMIALVIAIKVIHYYKVERKKKVSPL